jgi:hypothetical protein
MKKLFLLLGLLLFTIPAHGAISFVQCASNSSGSGVSTITTTISPTAGNALIAEIFIDNSTSTITSIKDSAGNSFTVQTNVVLNTRRIAFAYLTSIASGLTGVTSIISANQFEVLTVCEYSGLAASPADALDTTGSHTTGGTWTTQSMTPTAGLNEVIIGTVIDRNGFSSPTCTALGFTKEFSISGGPFGETGAWCDNIAASTSGSYTASGAGTNGDQLDAIGASYKAAAAGASGGGGIGGNAGLGGKAGFGFKARARIFQ